MQNQNSNTSVAAKSVMVGATRHNVIAYGKAQALVSAGWNLVGVSEGWAVMANPDKKFYQIRARMFHYDADMVVSQVESRTFTRKEWAAWEAMPQHASNGLFAQEVASNVWYVLGETYRNRVALKQRGGRFNASNGGWKFTTANLPYGLLTSKLSKFHMLAFILSGREFVWVGDLSGMADRFNFGYRLQLHADKRGGMPQDPDAVVVVCDRCEVAEVGHVCADIIATCRECNNAHRKDEACPELCGNCDVPVTTGCSCAEEFEADMRLLEQEADLKDAMAASDYEEGLFSEAAILAGERASGAARPAMCEACDSAIAVNGCFCVPCGDKAQYNDLDANGQY